MTKKPRPSINDQLARIAAGASASPTPASVATSPRDDVTTLPRDDVETSSVAISDVAPAASPSPVESTGPDGYKRRVRYEKPHASVYAHPRVFKALREIAAAQDCKPHDLYLEGLRMVLRQHGRDFDALNRGE